MSLMPESTGFDETFTTVQMPSKTWCLDFGKGKINGVVDGTEAVRQAIFLILATQRYEYDIYSVNYGNELENLIGQEQAYVRARAPGMIQEALIQDDRIQAVSNFVFQERGSDLLLTFTVTLTSGEQLTEEVTVNT